MWCIHSECIDYEAGAVYFYTTGCCSFSCQLTGEEYIVIKSKHGLLTVPWINRALNTPPLLKYNETRLTSET